MAAGTLVSSGTSANIPTGSGSERLRRATIHVLNNDTQEILSGTAGHIYTILSIIFCDQGGTSGKIMCRMNNGTHDISILSDPTIVPAYDTFVWNDKIVLEGGDALKITLAGSGNLDVYYSYIDQNWT